MKMIDYKEIFKIKTDILKDKFQIKKMSGLKFMETKNKQLIS